jgi:hypothetical protein
MPMHTSPDDRKQSSNIGDTERFIWDDVAVVDTKQNGPIAILRWKCRRAGGNF